LEESSQLLFGTPPERIVSLPTKLKMKRNVLIIVAILSLITAIAGFKGLYDVNYKKTSGGDMSK